jgi:ParB/RepB/Spo0J family partition protein
MAELRMLPVSCIQQSPHNPRRKFDEASLATLAQSIARLGVIQPVLVTVTSQTDIFELVAGERRWRASLLANKEDIPAFVVTHDDPMLREVQLVENLEREQLNPIDEAIALQNMKDICQISDAALAERFKRSQHFVRQRLGLLSLCPELQQCVVDGRLSLGTAVEISSIEDHEEQRDLAQAVMTNDLSNKQAAVRVNQLKLERRLRANQASKKLSIERKTQQLSQTKTVVPHDQYDPKQHHRIWDLLFADCGSCPRKGVFVRKDGQVEDICVEIECYEENLRLRRVASAQSIEKQRADRLAAFSRILQVEDVSRAHLQYVLWSLATLMGNAADGWRQELKPDGVPDQQGSQLCDWNLIEAWSEEQLLTGILRLCISHMASLDNDVLPRGLRQSLQQCFQIPAILLEESARSHEA